MATQIERERKFLITSPQDPTAWPVDYAVTKISQTYLKQERLNVVERIRVAETDGQVKIILCMKEYLGPGENRETETTIVDISTAEWMMLQERADPTRGTIGKTRYTFDWNGLTYELDQFHDPELSALLLEVELDDIDDPVVIPEFLRSNNNVVRDVTGDPEWTNHQIALLARDINL